MKITFNPPPPSDPRAGWQSVRIKPGYLVEYGGTLFAWPDDKPHVFLGRFTVRGSIKAGWLCVTDSGEHVNVMGADGVEFVDSDPASPATSPPPPA